MQRRSWLRWATLILILPLVLLSLWLFYSVYRRSQTQFQLAQGAVMVEGVITEKLTQPQPDRLLPFSPTAYVVRYAYPTLEGRVRTGEQTITRAVYDSLGDQGDLVQVVIRADDPSISAIDPALNFPAAAGWRLGIAISLLLAAYVLLLIAL